MEQPHWRVTQVAGTNMTEGLTCEQSRVAHHVQRQLARHQRAACA